MSDPLPAEITVTELPDGVHYRLPPRELRAFRSVGLGLFLLGLILCSAPIFPIWKLVQSLVHPGANDLGFLWLGAVILGIPFCIGGMHVLPVGLFILAGHSEIELRGGTLRAFECCGPIRWKWERETASLRRFFVGGGLEPARSSCGIVVWSLGTRGVITPEWKAAVGEAPTKPMRLAPGYPRDWLLALARDLARRCSLATAEESVAAPSASAAVLPVLEKEPYDSEHEELMEQPTGSKIQVDRTGEELTLTVPPLASRHMLGFFIGGALICVVAFGASQNVFADEKDRMFSSVELSALFAVGLWALGIGFMVAGVNVALKRAILAVVGDTLIVLQKGLFGEQREQWLQEQVADVFVRHHPDSEGPDRWELEIHPNPGMGSPLRLLSYRDPAELRWLATLLRRALRCPCNSPGSPPPGLIVQSPRIVLRKGELACR